MRVPKFPPLFRHHDSGNRITRRAFLERLAALGTFLCANKFLNSSRLFAQTVQSQVFKVSNCPVHDGQLRHEGLDALLSLLAQNSISLYKSTGGHPWAAPNGLIDINDVVVIKVNCQWKCRGTTNTDVLSGLVYRILQHPDGFNGEVVIIENGQGQGSFSGYSNPGAYAPWPLIQQGVYVNAEDETVLTIDYLVNTVFQTNHVSSFLLDPIRSNFIALTEHAVNGYRLTDEVSYPCFTTAGGHRVELREGLWNGSGYDSNLKLINLPVLKTHDGTGMTGALKHMYGILSMTDGYGDIRHYAQAGVQMGKMWSLVRAPDLNILDCIWVSFDSLSGYPPEATARTNILLAGMDPVAIDYHASKYILLPLGGASGEEHNPDSAPDLKNLIASARDFINTSGGIGGRTTNAGDANINVVSVALPGASPGASPALAAGGGGSGGGGCFIATAAYGSPMAEQVKLLEYFRDRYLQRSRLGRAAVRAYYTVSPKLAALIRTSPLRRRVARLILLPIVKLSRLLAARG